jgi:hypothetical protein
MTPLHLVCNSICEIYTGDEEDCTCGDTPTCDVISTLLKAYPTAVTLEDKEGTSALEHAILSGAPVDVVNLLQTITCQQNQMKAHQNQMKAHENQMKAQQEINIVSITKSRRVRYERQLAQRWLTNNAVIRDVKNLNDIASL